MALALLTVGASAYDTASGYGTSAATASCYNAGVITSAHVSPGIVSPDCNVCFSDTPRNGSCGTPSSNPGVFCNTVPQAIFKNVATLHMNSDGSCTCFNERKQTSALGGEPGSACGIVIWPEDPKPPTVVNL